MPLDLRFLRTSAGVMAFGMRTARELPLLKMRVVATGMTGSGRWCNQGMYIRREAPVYVFKGQFSTISHVLRRPSLAIG